MGVEVLIASAGSGKTQKLSEKYIQLVLSGIDFSKILAITFTNKAAIEMQERILGELKKRAIEKNDNKAKDTVFRIISQYSDFNVKTIDSFIDSILKVASKELGLPPIFTILEDPSPHIEKVIDELLFEQGEKKLFFEFIKNYVEIERKEGWYVRNTIIDLVNKLREKENERGKSFVLYPVEREEIKNKEEEIKKELNIEEIDKFVKSKKIEKLNKEIKEKIANYYKDKSFCRYNSYIKILNKLKEKLNEISEMKQVVFIDELNSYVSKLFTDEDSVPFIYYKLGDKIQHFLIDEFHDTNELQWHNILPLVDDSIASGGSLFCIGDKKQSIYRFRGGSSALIDKVINKFAVSPEIIKVNYRSRKNIVEYNNQVYKKENLNKLLDSIKNDEIKEIILSTYSGAEQEYSKLGGYVFVSRLETRDEAKDKLIKLLKNELLPRVAPKNITILVRENEDEKELTQCLASAGIPVVSDVTIDIRGNTFIGEIISLLKFLDTPEDNISFATFITGKIFLEDAKIERKKIYDWLEEQLPGTNLWLSFKSAFTGCFEKIEKFFSFIGKLSIYDLISKILYEFNVRNHFVHYECFYMKLLELAKYCEDMCEFSLKNFITYWEKGKADTFLITLPELLDAVRIMTIHKAKGLTFPVVIIPFAEIRVKKRHLNKIFVENENNQLLCYITQSERNASLELKNIYNNEEGLQFLDELNAMYVATTRASDELYIFLTPDSKNNKNYAIPLLLGDDNEKIIGKLPEYKEWREKLPISEKVELDENIRELKLRGEIIHYALSLIIKPKNIEEAVENCLDMAIKEKGEIKDKEIVKNNIIKTISKVKNLYLLSDLDKVYNEKEILNECGKVMRIDRLVISDNNVYVIEYKTGEKYEEKHKEQVRNYISQISKIYSNKNIKGYLLYIDDCEVKEL